MARGEGTSAKEEGGEELGRDAWSSLTAGGGSGAARSGERHGSAPAGNRAGEQAGGRGKGPVCNF